MGHRNPVSHLGGQAHGLPLLGRRRSRRVGGLRAARADGPRRGEPGAQAGQLRLAVLRRRQQGVLRLRLRHEDAGRAVRPGASGERVAEQHRAARAAAGAEADHLVSGGEVARSSRSSASGGRTAMAGPVFYRDDFRSAARPFPAYYDGKLFAYEWMRGWIMAVTMDAKGDIVSMERFMPSTKFSNPIDLEFAPSGDLYMLEYGTGWFQRNADARLVRIEYNGGQPRAGRRRRASTSRRVRCRSRVALSSAGTADADGDALRYEWTITGPDGAVVTHAREPEPDVHLRQAGRLHRHARRHRRARARASTAQTRIVAGNEPPQVAIDVVGATARSTSRARRSATPRASPTARTARSRAGASPRTQVVVTAEYLKDGPPAAAPAGHRAAPAVHAGAGADRGGHLSLLPSGRPQVDRTVVQRRRGEVPRRRGRARAAGDEDPGGRLRRVGRR